MMDLSHFEEGDILIIKTPDWEIKDEECVATVTDSFEDVICLMVQEKKYEFPYYAEIEAETFEEVFLRYQSSVRIGKP